MKTRKTLPQTCKPHTDPFNGSPEGSVSRTKQGPFTGDTWEPAYAGQCFL